MLKQLTELIRLKIQCIRNSGSEPRIKQGDVNSRFTNSGGKSSVEFDDCPMRISRDVQATPQLPQLCAPWFFTVPQEEPSDLYCLVAHPWWTTPVIYVDDLPPQKSHENHQGWFTQLTDQWDEPTSGKDSQIGFLKSQGFAAAEAEKTHCPWWEIIPSKRLRRKSPCLLGKSCFYASFPTSSCG